MFRAIVECFFFFKQKTAYEMRISDWSSDVCSSDLVEAFGDPRQVRGGNAVATVAHRKDRAAIGAARKDDRDIAAGRRVAHRVGHQVGERAVQLADGAEQVDARVVVDGDRVAALAQCFGLRSEEHTSELQSLMRISYAVFC